MEQSEEICEEVLALLDRMDKFPSEFMDDDLYSSRWGWISNQVQSNSPICGFTEAERGAITRKLTELTRVKMKDQILKTILHAREEMTQRELLDTWELTRGVRQRGTPYPGPYIQTTGHTASIQALDTNAKIQAIQTALKDTTK